MKMRNTRKSRTGRTTERQLTPPENKPTHPEETPTCEPETFQCAVCGDETTAQTDPPAVCSASCAEKLDDSRPEDDPRPPEEQEIDRMETAMNAAAERGL